MSDYKVTDSELTGIANAIRTKGGTSSPLVFPNGFTSAIGAIPTGGGSTLITKNITQNGTYDAEDDNADGYSSVVVNVSGGGSSEKDISYLPNSDSSKILCSMDVNIASSLVVDVGSGSGMAEMGTSYIRSLPVENGAIKLQDIGIHVPLSYGSANSTSYLVSKRNTGNSEIFIHTRNGTGNWPFFNNKGGADYAVFNSSNTAIGISAYDWHLYAMAIDASNKVVRFFCDGSFLGQKNYTTSAEPDNNMISFNSRDRIPVSNYGGGDLSVEYMGVVEDFESDATVIANMQTIMSKLGLTA